MVSLYTHKADTRGDRDHWLRKPALVVLLYEGIVANVLDFDYAPQSELIENRRIWMNVSQVRQWTTSWTMCSVQRNEDTPIDVILQQVLPLPWAIVSIFKSVDFVLSVFLANLKPSYGIHSSGKSSSDTACQSYFHRA